MNVVYFAIGEQCAAEAELVASVLPLTNPEADAWVLTDKQTQFKALKPYRMHSSPATLIFDRTIMQLNFLRDHGSGLFLDSDCVANGPLNGLFEGPVALTDRKPPKEIPEQIYNGGVLYADGPQALRFWQVWVDMYQQMDREGWKWYGDQMILPYLVKHFSPHIYPSATHNYVSRKLYELNSVLPAHIIHFKGRKRKPFIQQYVDTLKAAYRGNHDIQRTENSDLRVA